MATKKTQDAEGVTLEERYRFVTSQLSYFNEKIIEAFNLFIKLLTAIVGGVIWLRLQTDLGTVWIQIRGIVIGLVMLVGLSSILLVIFNLSSWWGFRKAESFLLNGKIPPPVFPKSARQELLMMLVIAVSTIGASILIWNLK
jgi:hypothetical protein